MNNLLEVTLSRSDSLDEALSKHLEASDHDGTTRSGLTVAICGIAFEHGDSLRTLMALGNHSSAVALLRLQFESLVRAMWILYAANDQWVEKLSAPLSISSEQTANSAPSVAEMMKAIESSAAHPRAGEMLRAFHSASWKSLNSFVHTGIHPASRFTEGYPISFLLQIVQNSNALTVMTTMVLVLLSGNGRLAAGMTPIQLEFKDCLPPLVGAD